MDVVISKEAELKIELVDGQFVFSIIYQGQGVKSELKNSFTPSYFFSKLEAAIPGTLDDSILEGLKLAFGLK